MIRNYFKTSFCTLRILKNRERESNLDYMCMLLNLRIPDKIDRCHRCRQTPVWCIHGGVWELCLSCYCSLNYFVSPLHVSRCDSSSWWIGRTFCCIRQRDRRRGGLPCEFARVCVNWSRVRSAFRIPRRCIGRVFRPCVPIGVAWVWNSRRRPCHIRHTHAREVRVYVSVCATPNYHEIVCCILCGDRRYFGRRCQY